jgi:CDP-glycerol glycerophosphotransferase (TagB/SpsB family)
MKFSIIVVAYNIENFIEQALLSCVFKGRDDYEVIVVENKSTDNSLKYARRVANAHPGIFRIIENAQNSGLGAGRNIGLAAAQGDYILFLDGDDWYAPTILDRLTLLIETYSSDVFVFNHARAFDDGRVVRNKLSKILHEGPRDTPIARADIMRNFGVAWNKAYKRSFIERNSLKFGDRFYEDIDWNFEVLLLAETFFAIPEVLVYYRQRTGSITRSTDIRHFDILAQYYLVIDLLKRDPDFVPNYGLKIYRYAFDQCLSVLKSERLPHGSHAEYLRQFADLADSFRATIGRHHLNHTERLVSRRDIRWFRRGLTLFAYYDRTAKHLNLWKERAAKLKKLIEKKWRQREKARERKFYKELRDRVPLDEKLVLLESYWGQKIDCNPYALALELEKKGYDCLWAVHEDAKVPPGYSPRTVVKYSKEYLRALATAKYLISNANFPDDWEKREGQVHVHTFHGTPLKLMGLDIIKTNPKEMDWKKYAKRSMRWDYALSSNEYSTRVWRQNAPYHYRILETGYPRNDILFRSDPDLLLSIRSQIGIPDGKKVALYAPTFRDIEKSQTKILDESTTFDATAVQQALGDDWVLLVRGHYFVNGETSGSNPSVIDASKHVVTNEVCLVSDLLITDYSSIMFDYACLSRPIVLYLYDFDDYASSRGMYFDIREDAPGYVAFTFEALLDGLRSQVFSAENQGRLAAFSRRFCSFDDGGATARVVAEVFEKNIDTSDAIEKSCELGRIEQLAPALSRVNE